MIKIGDFTPILIFLLIYSLARCIIFMILRFEVLKMSFDWITPQEAAEKWGISDRRVQALCANGQVEGVIRLRRSWLIPKDTPKPIDGRYKNGRKPASHEQEQGK